MPGASPSVPRSWNRDSINVVTVQVASVVEEMRSGKTQDPPTPPGPRSRAPPAKWRRIPEMASVSVVPMLTTRGSTERSDGPSAVETRAPNTTEPESVVVCAPCPGPNPEDLSSRAQNPTSTVSVPGPQRFPANPSAVPKSEPPRGASPSPAWRDVAPRRSPFRNTSAHLEPMMVPAGPGPGPRKRTANPPPPAAPPNSSPTTKSNIPFPSMSPTVATPDDHDADAEVTPACARGRIGSTFAATVMVSQAPDVRFKSGLIRPKASVDTRVPTTMSALSSPLGRPRKVTDRPNPLISVPGSWCCAYATVANWAVAFHPKSNTVTIDWVKEAHTASGTPSPVRSPKRETSPHSSCCGTTRTCVRSMRPERSAAPKKRMGTGAPTKTSGHPFPSTSPMTSAPCEKCTIGGSGHVP